MHKLRLPVKVEFHVSSKMRQASGCDAVRKIERVMGTAYMGDGCSRRGKIRCNQRCQWKKKCRCQKKNNTSYNDIEITKYLI